MFVIYTTFILYSITLYTTFIRLNDIILYTILQL